jgi:hypothetical protein
VLSLTDHSADVIEKEFHVDPELSLKSKTTTEIARAYSLL